MKELINRIICRFKGHIWKRQKDGWTTEGTHWDPEKAQAESRRTGKGISFRGMTRPWKYYRCLRCDAIGE